MNLLNYYVEIYGTTKENISDEYLVRTNIYDINNQSFSKLNKKVKSSSESRVEIGSLNIENLKTGSYILEISVEDSVKNIKVDKQKRFFIFNSKDVSNAPQLEQDFMLSEFTNLSEKQIDDEFNKCIYIRSEEENKNFEKLNSLDSKRKFLYQFWKKRDTNPYTPQCEYRLIYLQKVAKATQDYHAGFRDGWKTDRGRIFIIYGKPDEIERFPFESDTKAYEIWHYEAIEGGAICVFVEIQQASNDYELVHSTLRNELRNDNWTTYIKKYFK